MSNNRFSLGNRELRTAPGASPLASSGAMGAFLVCPLPLLQGGGVPPLWQQVYQLALEQAQAVVRPSRWERLVAPSAN